MNFKYLLSFLIVFTLKIPVIGNPALKFEKLNYLSGLSDNTVNCFLQDHTGFIWIGTDNGLNKYDGYNFTLFNTESLNALSSNRITNIIQDKNGLLWIGTQKGLNCLDAETNQITIFNPDISTSNSLANANVRSICCGKPGELWIGTNGGGLQRLIYGDDGSIDHATFENIHFKGDSLSYLKNINVIKKDQRGNLWLGSDKGVFRYHPETDELFHFSQKLKRLLNKKKISIQAIYESSDGNIWVGTYDNGLLVYRYSTDEFQKIQNDPGNVNSLSSNRVTCLTGDEQGNIWCGTFQDGLNKISYLRNGSVVIDRIQNDPKVENSLIDNDIRFVAFDRSGVMWVGTLGNGVNKVSFFPQYFGFYLTEGDNPAWNGLHGVSAIAEQNARTIWIGSGSSGTGLFRYDRVSNESKYYSNNTEPDKLNYPIVSTLCCDHNQNIWIGTLGGGINCYQAGEDRFTYYEYVSNHKNWPQSNYISCIFQDSDGEYWIGTSSNGLHRIRDAKDINSVSHHYKHNKENHSIAGNRINFIYEDKAGYIWIAVSNHGVDRFDKRTGKFTHYSNDPNDPETISDNYVNAICEDSNGSLWFGTKSGLNQFDPAKDSFKRFLKEDGLPDNQIFSALCDDSGNIWFANRNLLSRLTISTGRIKTFSRNYGLEDCKFNYRSCFKCKNGELLFGTENKGVLQFHPDRILEPEILPIVVMTNLKISNQEVPVGSNEAGEFSISRNIASMSEIELKFSDNVFSLEFVALNYFRQDEIKYAYQLENVNKEWQYTDDRNRAISYSNLSPGEYLFRVKARSSDGNWNEQPTELLIRILPPWWRTHWAYFLYIIAIGGIVSFSWLYSIRQVKLKDQLRFERMAREKDNELNRMKLRFFTNISHEFRTPLTLLIGPLAKLKESDEELTFVERKKKYALMHRNAFRLLQLINQLMDFRKVENGRLENRLEQGQITAFIRRVIAPFEEQAQQKEIEFSIKTQQESIFGWYDADKLEKIIYNLLSNAFKYTNTGGAVEMTVSEQDGSLDICVADTGIGIDNENLNLIFERFYQESQAGLNTTPGTGIGLALTKKLIEGLHGTIEVKSIKGKGSEFKVTLPYKKEDFSNEECVTGIGQEQKQLSEHEEDETSGLVIVEPIDETTEKKSLSGINPIVLIVEDNEDIREYIGDNLSNSYRILEASNGKAGLERCLKSMPDLVISDVMMPEMDGLEFCRLLKTDSRISHIPVILLTAKTSLEQRIEGLDTGADAYITKPFDAEYLAKRVAKLIENRQNLRKLYSEKFSYAPIRTLVTNKTDEEFLNQVTCTIEENLSNSGFRVEDLYQKIGMSRSHFFNKIKMITDQSGSDFIKSHRLKVAATLLKKGDMNISEVAYEVGFSDPKYFAKVFRKQFGVSPSKFTGK